MPFVSLLQMVPVAVERTVLSLMSVYVSVCVFVSVFMINCIIVMSLVISSKKMNT